jgi:putative ABC transport system permease protein
MKVISDLKGNLSRSLLVILSIAVGLFALGMIFTIDLVVSKDMRTGYSQINPPNIQMKISGIDDEVLTRIENIDGISHAEGIRQFGLRIRDKDGEWARIEITAREKFENVDINQIKVVDGSLKLLDRDILIDQFKLKKIAVFSNDLVHLELPSGKTRDVHINGIIKDQTIGVNSIGGGFFTAPAQGYVQWEILPWLEQDNSYNKIIVTILPEYQQFDRMRAIAEEITEIVKKNDGEIIDTVIRTSEAHPNAIYADAISAILYILGVLVVFLSTFLIFNTLTALMNQQIQQVGIMKSIGATRNQIVTIYMVLILIYGFLAFCIALPLSFAAGFRLVIFLADKANYEFLGYRFLWQPALILFVIAMIIPQIAGYFPIKRGSKLKVNTALQGGNNFQNFSHGGRLLRWLKGSKSISRPTLISLRNTFRQRNRLILTLITLTLGGAIFIATFNVQIALTKYTEQVAQYFLADVNLDFVKPYRISKIQEELSMIQEIKQVEGWSFAPSQVILENGQIGDSVQLIGPPIDTTLLQAIVEKGRWLEKDDHNSIVLNEVFQSNFPDLNVGDNIKLRVAGEDTEWKIVGFFKLVGKSAGYIAYTDYLSLANIKNTQNHTSVFRIAAKSPTMSVEEQKDLAIKIASRMRERGYRILQVEAGKTSLDSATDGLNIITIFLLIMALLTALVGSIGLMGTMSLNVMDRTREIGVLRAIGASDYAIFRLILIEGFIVGLISWFSSIIVAIPITKLLSDAISNSIFDSPGLFAYSFKGVFIWLSIVIVLSVISSILPALKAVKLTIREVLAYE